MDEKKWKKENRSHFLLVDLETNRESEVVSIQTRDPKKLQKLITLGIFPGMKLALIQKFPSYIFQMGYSQFVMDKHLAECVLCRPHQKNHDPVKNVFYS
jgi:Fe2+ transport system protein FeoA